MARKIRIENAGAAYHVVARGNQGRDIYADDRDRICGWKRWAKRLESPACWRCRKAWGGSKAGASSSSLPEKRRARHPNESSRFGWFSRVSQSETRI
jgi:hypothetical protein